VARGQFIVIEGSDGSGKSTQFKLLVDYLTTHNIPFASHHFPRYEEPSSYFVREYLSGAYGGADEQGAYKPSLFYALDRFAAGKGIRDELAEGKIVLCDRYIGSNMAHQGQKLGSKQERTEYFSWLHHIEYDILGIPKPDYNIVLSMPAEISVKLMKQRDQTKNSVPGDIHEADAHHLERSVATYREICELFPSDFWLVESAENGSPRPIDAIHQEIVNQLQL
jgi:dTMP kinase